MRVLPLALLTLVCAGCISSSSELRPGVTVPITELRQEPSLVERAARELAGGEVDEGFFVLEALKTARYAAMARADEADEGATDLRPLFARLMGGDQEALATRGLLLAQDQVPADVSREDTAGEQRFWDREQLVEGRLRLGLPEELTFAHDIGIITSEQARFLFDPADRFVSYLVSGGTVWAVVVGPHGARSVALETPTATVRATLRQLLAALRDPRTGDAWRAPASALHQQILAPLGDDVAAARVLYVSPHDLLSSVPWAVLLDASGAPEIERRRTTLLVSASVHRATLGRPLLDEPPRMLSVGNPTYPDGVPPLPAAEEEAVTVGRVFGEADVLVGAEATEGAIRAKLAEHNVVHFATHGVLLGQLLPGASSLLLAPDDTGDGFLSAREVASEDLSHLYLAMLSACETSVSDDAASDLGSLGGAFLVAGTPTVVGSLWQVSDDATTRLMLRFYASFLEQGSGAALRAAQRSLRAEPATAHPFYWGAFVLYGWDR